MKSKKIDETKWKPKTKTRHLIEIEDRLTSLEQRMDKASKWFVGLEERTEEQEKKMENTEDAVRMLLDDRYWEKPSPKGTQELREKIEEVLWNEHIGTEKKIFQVTDEILKLIKEEL
jgi:uncharacterized coiled-coil protein SlyX